MLGALTYAPDDGEKVSIGVAQSFVPSISDGWTAILSAAYLLGLSAMIGFASHLGDEPRVEERAAVVREQAGAALDRTFVFNPHVRLALDGHPGVTRTAPQTKRFSSRIYVVDPEGWWDDERRLFDDVRRDGGSFRDWTAGGLEFHERLE